MRVCFKPAGGNRLHNRSSFVSDYGAAENANTSGITFSNLVQRGVYTAWQGRLLTAQAGWILLRAGEDWAIYKIREGGQMEPVWAKPACYLNVVGDWLFYCNGGRQPDLNAHQRQRKPEGER